MKKCIFLTLMACSYDFACQQVTVRPKAHLDRPDLDMIVILKQPLRLHRWKTIRIEGKNWVVMHVGENVRCGE
jgi:hypothetical protein